MAVAQGHVPRLLHLVRLLEKRRECSVKEIARELGIAEREVIEDVRMLSTCGIPPYSPADLFEIELDGDRVSLAHEMLTLPRFQLAAAEVAALRLAADLAASEGWGESRALRRAIVKLEAALIPRERERGRRLARRIGLPGAGLSVARHLATLERAVRENLEIEMSYFSESSEKLTRRRVRPYAVAAAPEGRYLLALDTRPREIRTFRIDRIQRLKLTRKHFEPPDGFDAADHLPWATSQEDKRIDVLMRFDPEVARLAGEQFRGAKVEKDGSLSVRLKVWPGAGFWRLVLAWGGACEVIEPDSERRAVRAYAEEIAAAHAK